MVLLDVWGYHKLYLKASKITYFIKIMRTHKRLRKLYFRREFIYSLAKRIRFRKRKKFELYYINPRYLYNYYLIIRRRTYKKYIYKAKRKYGSMGRNYFAFIEGRLFMLLYRANFVNNMFKLKFIIDRGLFQVNGKIKFFANHNVKVGELVQIHFKYLQMFKNDLKLRFINRNILWSPSKYLFVSYKFMFIFFLRAPDLDELKFPIRFDLYAGGDIYFL